MHGERFRAPPACFRVVASVPIDKQNALQVWLFIFTVSEPSYKKDIETCIRAGLSPASSSTGNMAELDKSRDREDPKARNYRHFSAHIVSCR